MFGNLFMTYSEKYNEIRKEREKVIKCLCGGKYKRHYKRRHFRCKRHIKGTRFCSEIPIKCRQSV